MASTKAVTLESIDRRLRNVEREIHEVKEAVVEEELSDEDLEFIRGTRQAWKEVDGGGLQSYAPEEFSKKLRGEW